MATVAVTDPVLVSPPGYENVDVGYASEDIEAGDPVVITSDTPPSRRFERVFAKASGSTAHGIALKDVNAGGTCEAAYRGEMDGFAGLTPGAPIYVVGGELDDAAPSGGGEDPDPVPATTIRAVGPTRIRFDLV